LSREVKTLPAGDQKIVKVQMVSQVTREEILKDNIQICIQVYQTIIVSATNVEDLTRFATMSKYFRGSITLRR
jgi:hypothetical protein